MNQIPENNIQNGCNGSKVTKPNEGFEKFWYCVAICDDGSVFMEDADSPTRFLGVLSKAIIAWVDFRTNNFEKDLNYAALEMGFSNQLISNLSGESRLLFEDFDNEMGMKLPSIQIRINEYLDVKAHQTLLLIRKNFILTIHPFDVDRRFSRLRRYAYKILKRIPLELTSEDRLTILLARIVDQNNDRNFEHLRQIEEHGDSLNEKLMNPNTPRNLLGPAIYHMKHALIIYLNALWETVDVLHDLRYGDADLVTEDPALLERVGVLAMDVNSQIGLAEHMSDVLASGLEVLQTIYNNQLQSVNNRLALVVAYLTILGTAVLVPNTLATILGNSAFDLQKEDQGWYILLLIVSTVAATALCFWWVKRLGLLPEKVDKISEL
jgi:magnesium transporter